MPNVFCTYERDPIVQVLYDRLLELLPTTKIINCDIYSSAIRFDIEDSNGKSSYWLGRHENAVYFSIHRVFTTLANVQFSLSDPQLCEKLVKLIHDHHCF